MPGRWMCLNDHPAGDDDTVCGQCGADVVWRREQPTDPLPAPHPQRTAWGWILVGFVLAVVGAAVAAGFANEDDAGALVFGGYVVTALGATLTAIGIVAEGVRIGRNLSR